jgi:hypothetical protein
MQDRKKFLDKVTKLLAMAKDKAANETEAATALRQAESLMRKHDINFAEVEANTLKSDDLQRAETEEARNSKWVWNMAWAAAYLTSTLPTKRRGKIQFCGTRLDCEVSLLYFDYLVGVGDRLARNYQGCILEQANFGISLRSQRNAFKMGLAQSIVERAKKIKAEREAAIRSASQSSGKDLVVMKDKMIKSQFGLVYRTASASRFYSDNGMSDGILAGRKVSLNSQVTNTQRAALA